MKDEQLLVAQCYVEEGPVNRTCCQDKSQVFVMVSQPGRKISNEYENKIHYTFN